MFKRIAIALTVAFASSLPTVAFAQTGNQGMNSNVPPVLTITPPSSSVTESHPGNSSNHVFTTQTWSVASNNATGVNVVFEANQPFTHTSSSSYKRNAKLDLALGTTVGPGWAIGTATDSTDYAAGTPKLTATVTGESTGAGTAAFDVQVTFLTGTYATIAAGTYSTTVVGTVTAKP
jgi:hypothetical protein